jgi:hypothetical protein
MATKQTGRQIRDDSIQREDLCATIAGKSVIKKVIAGNGIDISSTGIDDGTGDVTIAINPGSLVKQYIHHQVIPSNVWFIQHEMEGYPEVVLLDESGERLQSDIYYDSSTIIRAVFASEVSGRAALSLGMLTQQSYTQTTPNSVWTVNHNMDRYPEVIVFDTSLGNLRVYGDILYPTSNSLSVVFSSPMMGELYFV